jgi:hypothetical protein
MPQLGPDHERNGFSVPWQPKPHMKRGNAFRRAAAWPYTKKGWFSILLRLVSGPYTKVGLTALQ